MLVCALTGCNSSSVAELEHILSFPHTLPAALPQPGSVKWHGFIFYTQQIHKSLGQCRFLASSVCGPQAVSMCVAVCVCVHACVCVCVCVCGRNELNVYAKLTYPCISSFCAMYTSTHTAQPQTIWGQRTDGATSEYCQILTLCCYEACMLWWVTYVCGSLKLRGFRFWTVNTSFIELCLSTALLIT